jgi:RNA polymerase sigma factor (TIGR02999 family)
MDDVSRILDAIGSGDKLAADELLPAVYDDLRKLAAWKLSNEPPGQSLQATALVHEAYLKLVAANAGQQWSHRGHFFLAAAEAMRRILINRAVAKRTQKRGGGAQRVALHEAELVIAVPGDKLLDLNEALEKLAEKGPEEAKLVKLRYFAGMTLEEAAEALGISRATASRYWTYAKAFLQTAVSEHSLPD